MVIYQTRPRIKQLSLRRRHLGLTARDQTLLVILKRRIKLLAEKLIYVRQNPSEFIGCAETYILAKIYSLYYRHRQICNPSVQLNAPLPPIVRLNRNINSFTDEEIPMLFRFRTKQQLHRLLCAFRVPEWIRSSRHRFHKEEWLLVSLYRLHRPTTCSDPFFRDSFGFDDVRVSLCFNSFVQFIAFHWGYLVCDNMNFWLDKLPQMAEAIRQKQYVEEKS
jgi:hypothetical protein